MADQTTSTGSTRCSYRCRPPTYFLCLTSFPHRWTRESTLTSFRSGPSWIHMRLFFFGCACINTARVPLRLHYSTITVVPTAVRGTVITFLDWNLHSRVVPLQM